MKLWNNIKQSQITIPVLALAILLIFNLFFSPGFFTLEIKDGHLYGRIIDILKNVAPLALLAIGMTLVIATGGTDISVGSVMAISGAVSCSILNGLFPMFGNSFAWAVIMGLFAGVLCGGWNGFLIAKIKIQPIVATLILMTAGRGIAQLITQGKIIRINQADYIKQYYFLGSGYFLGLPFAIFIVLFVFLIMMLFVKRTAFGLFLESLGINSRSCVFSGINVDTIKIVVFSISGLMAGLAGILVSASIKSADANNAGLFYELDAILSVAIGGNSLNGGKFSIQASLIGALVIQTLTTTIYAFGVPPEVISLVKAFVVIAICLLQSKEFKAQFVKSKKKVMVQ